MEINKPNDIFVISSLDPEANVYDLANSDIIPDNTMFLDKETYKNTDFAKKNFVDESGNFDNIKFDNAYNKAANLYSELSNDKFLKDNLEWDAFDLMRPVNSKTKVQTLTIAKDINPYKNLYGRTSLDSISEGTSSIRELAQKSKIYDTKSGKFLDKSANDLGLLGSWFNDTLVYAQYDEDGKHFDKFSGRDVTHRKGDYKLDDDGNFYTETLGDREVFGRQIVNPTDLITTDGSVFNKIDYFDSDGKDKSVIGTTFKLATEIAPFFIPGVNTYYGGFKVATGLASSLPTFYKAIEGIISGNDSTDNDTDLYKAATKVEGFMARFNADSYSDKSQGSLWNYEQLGNMVASTFSQVYEQRAAASLSKLFYKVNNPEYAAKLTSVAEKELMKGVLSGSITAKNAAEIGEAAVEKIPELAKIGLKQSNLAKSLSLGYMALTSTSDIYHEAINGGYDKRTAGLAALLAAGGQYTIMMNNRMGDWFLDKTVGYDLETSRNSIKKAISPLLKEFETGIKAMDVNKEVGKKGLISTITKAKNSIKNILVEPLLASSTGEQLAKNAMVEGIEEVTEEAVMDATKGIVDTMSWLGLTKQKGSFNTIENTFSTSGLERYLGSLFGGAIGGGLFEINRLKIEPIITGKPLSPETEYSLTRLIANGKAQDIKNEIDKRINALGNSSMSPILSDNNGEKIYLFDDKTSQANVVATAAKKYVDYLDGVLNSENLSQSDEDVIKKTIIDKIKISDLENSGIDKFILSDFNKLSNEIVTIVSDINKFDKESEDGKKKLEELNGKLKEKREEVQSLLSGEKSEYYKQLSLFSLNRDLHSPFVSLNVVDYAKQEYNVDFYSLPEDGAVTSKKSVQDEFDNIMSNDENKKDKMKFMYSVFDTMNQKYSNLIGDYAEEKHILSREKFVNILTNAQLLSKEQLIDVQPELQKSGIPNYDLSESLNIPLGDILLDNGYLNISNLLPEEIDQVKNQLNSMRLPYKELTPEFLTKVFESEANSKLNEVAKKIEIESSQEGADAATVVAKHAEEINNINRLTPKLNNSTSNETLPLDLLYLSTELKGDSEIPAEIYDIAKKKISNNLERIKKAYAERVYLDPESIKEYFEEEESFDVSDEELEKINADVVEIKQRILDSKDSKELDTNINELKKYVSSIENSELESYIYNSIVDGLPEVSKSFLDSEKLLSKKVIDNKLYDLLNTINFDIYSGGIKQSTTILNILKDEIGTLNVLESPADYIRGKDIVNNMKQAVSTIGLVKALNAAMVNTEISPSNPYGFNVSLRNSISKTDTSVNPENYKVISSQASVLFNKELKRVEDKLNFLIQLSESNTSTIAAVQEQTRTNVNSLLLNILTNKDKELSVINLKINGESLIPEDKLVSIISQNKSEEEKLYDLEEAIYLSFNKHYSQIGDKALTDLFEPFNKPWFKEIIDNYVDTGLTRDIKEINSLDYFNYLHTIISSNSKVFYSKYKNLLEKELSLQSDKKASFFGQEFSIRSIYSYRSNKRIMGNSMKFIKNLLGDNRLYLNNSIIVSGSGGTGKTTVVSNFAHRFDDTNKSNVIVSAASDGVLEKLKSDINRGKDSEMSAFSKKQLFSNILKDQDDSFYFALDKLKNDSKNDLSNTIISDKDGNPVIEIKDFKKYEINLHPDFLSKLNYVPNETKDTVIYIDEISWFNPLELQLLDDIAGREGSNLYLIGLGDELQNGYSLNENKPYSLETFYYNHPPKLKGVVRAKNIHKKDNTELMEVSLKNRISNYIYPERFSLTTGNNINYFDKITLDGDKFSDTLSSFDLSKLDKNQEIAVITDDGTLSSEDKKKFSDAGIDTSTLKIVAKDKIQGNEYEQVVSLFKINYDPKSKLSLYNANKQLYTLLSRGRKSSLIVGNNNLLSDLGFTNNAKDTTSRVELMDVQIEDLLNKRFDFLNLIMSEYKEPEVEKVSDEIIKIEKEADYYDNTPNVINETDSDNKTEEVIKQSSKDYDGDNSFLTYSFYNVLHAKINDVNNSIDFEEFDGKTLSDLQILKESISESAVANMTPEEQINEFIIAKNHLLHGLEVPQQNLFYNTMKNFTNGKLVVRKLTLTDYTKPYGKQSHMRDESGKERMGKQGKDYLFLSIKSDVFTKDGKKVPAYVTLGALPDINNPNWNQEYNKETLSRIYNAIEPNQELEINASLEPLTGIRVIYENGTSKPDEKNNISISADTPQKFTLELHRKIPGLITTDLQTIRVFDDNTKHIEDEFNSTGYDLKNPKTPIKNTKNLRFRPFITVSYIDPNNKKVSKIMMLNTKKRSLLDAKLEYETIKEEYSKLAKADREGRNKYTKGEFPALISKWDGLVLFNEIMTSFKNIKEVDPNTGSLRDKTDIIIDKIMNIELDTSEKDTEYEVFDAFSKMLDILEKSDYNLKNVSKDNQKFLLGSIQGQTKLSNMGLRLLDVLSEEDIINFNKDRQVYYNPMWKPTHTEKHEKVMDGKFIKYFELNCFLEPPIFKLNINLDIIKEDKKESISEQPSVPSIQTASLLNSKSFIVPNFPNIPVDFSNWTDEESLKIGITSVYQAMQSISNNLKIIESKGDLEIKNKIFELLLPTVSELLKNPALVKANKDVNSAIANRMFEYLTNSPEMDEIVDYMFDNRLIIDDFFLTSKTLKSIIDIENQFNADICK